MEGDKMDEYQEMLELVSSLKWTFAKTRPKNPHEYIVRQEVGNEVYEKLYKYIYKNHYIEWFWRKPYKMVRLGDYKYWIMTDDITESRIINRKPVTQE